MPLNSSLATADYLLEAAQSLAKQHRLGFRTPSAGLQPCPMALRPWQLPAHQINAATLAAQSVGQRLWQYANSDALLGAALAPLQHTASLPAQLWQLWQHIPLQERRAIAISISRVDLLLDQQDQWRLVEANSIAAGMGPFSESLALLQQTLQADTPAMQYVDNPITARIAAELHAAAVAQCRQLGGEQPTVVFVVEANEDNIFDQEKISDALTRLGSRVVRLTLAEIEQQIEQQIEPQIEQPFDRNASQSAAPSHRPLRLSSSGTVHGLYFRTGYNLSDYGASPFQQQRLLALRQALETYSVFLAPTIPLQLASSKAVQMHWANNHANTPVFATAHLALDQLDPSVAIDPQQWYLKNQHEGGGNTVTGAQLFAKLADLLATETSHAERRQWFLMQKIPVAIRREWVPVLRNGKIERMTNLISELGVFVVGDAAQPAGYLVRSKPMDAAETGVHKGQGFLDCLAFR